jgi:hypothetical protein
VVSFTSRPLYPLYRIPRYPLYMRLGGPQSRLDAVAKEKIKSLHCPCRELNPSRPARNLVSTLTELPRLDEERILKCIFSWFKLASSCKGGSEPPGSIKGGEFLYQLSDNQLVLFATSCSGDYQREDTYKLMFVHVVGATFLCSHCVSVPSSHVTFQ